MKLFSKLVGKKAGKENKKAKNVPDFVGADPSIDPYDVESDGDLAPNTVKVPQLTDEEKGMILSDEMSLGRPDDYDPNFPVNRNPNNGSARSSRNRNAPGDGRESPSVGTPNRGGTPVQLQQPLQQQSPPSSSQHVNENVSRLYQAQSEHSLLNRIESFRNSSQQNLHHPYPSQQSFESLSQSHSRSFYNNGPPLPPPPPGLSQAEVVEINRLMSIGYNYEAALSMIGVNHSQSFHGPPMPYPVPVPAPMPMPMPVMVAGPPPPGYYAGPAPVAMMPPPYYPMPAPYPMVTAPPPPQRSASFRGSYYQDNDADVLLAIQRSLEEEERRRSMVSEDQLLVKEAVERANERAIQIALQRSFEEQYGPGSYQRYQEEQLANAMSMNEIPRQEATTVMSPRMRMIPAASSMDFNMIHNYGSVEIDESNPLRDDMMFDMPQTPQANTTVSTITTVTTTHRTESEDRPGVYYKSPSRPMSGGTPRTNSGNFSREIPMALPVNDDGSVGSQSQSGARNHVPSFRQSAGSPYRPPYSNDSFYEVAAER